MIFLNSVFGYNKPRLPKHDWLNTALRKAQLEVAKKNYEWTTSSPNLEGVPLLKTKIPLVVPYGSRPTLVWIFQVTDVVIKIVINLIEVLKEEADEEVKKVVEELVDHLEILQRSHTAAKVLLGKQGEEDFNEKLVETLKFSANMVKESIDGAVELVTGVTKSLAGKAEDVLGLSGDDAPDNPEQQQLNDIGKGLVAQFSKLNQTIMGLKGRLPEQALDNVAEFYDQMFQSLPVPKIAQDFATNTSFSQYRTQGPNPMLISLISGLKDNYGITEQGYKSVMGDDDSLEAALAEKRLFVCDYCELQSLTEQPSELYAPRFVPSPIAFFARPKGGTSLKPVAIQTKQTADKDDIVYAVESPNAPNYWKWMQAKTIVQNADGNYHELFVHLARTHLMAEAVAVATHRNLCRRHPIWVLLVPHFEGTLFINEAAAVSLIAEDGPINMVFGGSIHETQQIAGKDRLNYDFYQNMLKTDLKNRGVDDKEILPDYPYRDDAILIWDAIHVWTTDYVDVYYKSDKDVAGDGELIAWAEDIINNGQVAGFKVVETKAQLAEVLTMIIFTSSAQHAAVNFPQRTLMSYPPALSAAVYGTEPFPGTEQGWADMLPPFVPSIVQISTLVLLGSVYYRKLGEYRSNTFPYLPWFGDDKITRPNGPLDRFNQALDRIEKHIAAQNETRETPYPYLLPSQIPPSINI